MKKRLYTLAGALVMGAGVLGPASIAAARPVPTPVTQVTGTITCSSATSGLMILQPVDSNDMATGGPLSLGCGQYSPATTFESVSPGTVSYNYNGDYYLIGSSTVTSCGPGAAALGKSIACHSHGVYIKFSLVSS